MLMKVDTNIVFGEDIVLYDGRDAALAANSTDLDALVLSAGALVPSFEAGQKEYTINVANNVTSTTVTATRAVVGQVIKLGTTTLTSGVASAARNLAVGENTINVTVRSADTDNLATYQITVNRANA